MNKDFTGEVSTYNKDKFNILAPGEQFWDGFTPEEKAGKVLVVPKHKKDKNGNIDYQNYENLVIEKKDQYGKGIKGIQFCIADSSILYANVCDETYQYSNWVTKENGKLEIPTNELPLYNQNLIETGKTAKSYKPQEIHLYVDPGNRFLGEVKGTDFITYDELIATINGVNNPKEKKYEEGEYIKIGVVLSKGNDTSTGGNWLKIYDAREEKTLYIAKKPLINLVAWNDLFNAGVVYDLETLTQGVNHEYTYKELGFKDGKRGKNEFYLKEKYKPKTIIAKNGKTYLVRLLRGYNTVGNGGNPNIPSDKYKGDSKDAEWSRFIIPLVDYNTSSNRINPNNPSNPSIPDIPSNPHNKNANNKYLARFKWFGDMVLDNYRVINNNEYQKIYMEGPLSWTQEYMNSETFRTCVGSNYTDEITATAYDQRYYGLNNTIECVPSRGSNYIGFRPVLEEIN